MKNGTKKQTAKGGAKTKPKKKATPKPTAVPKPQDDSDEIVVFAIRLQRSERDLIHQAAGPAKATTFARTLLVAAARNDAATVQATMKAVQRKA